MKHIVLCLKVDCIALFANFPKVGPLIIESTLHSLFDQLFGFCSKQFVITVRFELQIDFDAGFTRTHAQVHCTV